MDSSTQRMTGKELSQVDSETLAAPETAALELKATGNFHLNVLEHT
jgi:hypothetical protein